MITLTEDTETLATRLATAQNLSVDHAVRLALEHEAHSVGLPIGSAGQSDIAATIAWRRPRVTELLRTMASLPTLDARSQDEIAQDLNAP